MAAVSFIFWKIEVRRKNLNRILLQFLNKTKLFGLHDFEFYGASEIKSRRINLVKRGKYFLDEISKFLHNYEASNIGIALALSVLAHRCLSFSKLCPGCE